ncbi:MAG: PD-(D/E)XK nuclease-like domain-containing protein [Actinomycetota bacterium]
MTTITGPGLFPDVPEDVYHADPVEGGSLSSSGSKLIIESPAKYRWAADNPSPSTAAQALGSAAHRVVLGSGPEIEEIDAADWRTKKAKEAKAEAEAAGKIPVLAKDFERVKAMADALREHPLAGPLLDPDGGSAEQTIVWDDPESGVRCRARLDWLRDAPDGGRSLVPDYKTARSAAPDAFGKSVYDYGYHQQACHYLDGVNALNLGVDPSFLFIVQETEPPHLVAVYQLDAQTMAAGRARNRWARQVYAECTANDDWPGYPPDVHAVSIPTWALRREGIL